MATVELDAVSKVYPNGVEAVQSVSLEIGDGELMVLVGPSGCGKTTVLRMVAGLEEISDGEVRIGGRVVNDVSPKDRDIAMVFQNYALYPHMTVAQNIGFGLKMRRLSRAEVELKVRSTAKMLGLGQWLDRKPAQLSGGQRQRVAMGRAIVREPKVFLMDEPLSNLDAKLRVQMRAEVSRIQRRLGVSMLYVTHDQTEAMTMGDRVAVLLGGVLQQCAAPQVLYERPINIFVAAFIGSPAMNMYEGGLTPDGTAVSLGSQRLELSEEVRRTRPALAARRGKGVVVGIRPEHISAAGPGDAAVLQGDVELLEALGSELLVHFSLDAPFAQVPGASTGSRDGQPDGDDSGTTSSTWGVARVDSGTRIAVGERAGFAVRAGSMHFFDPDTGMAIWDETPGAGSAQMPAS
ncbi:MAG: sn-glycerol-3-phosphate ABC transporter ATP-binding protein UgpC [Candidatus Dormiibacterota bacterium]|jgi:multiple sugar transport system ATP-binding protein